ncbi:unnamed protein product [Lathyrus sativus]|nr:unnamed protein product [Lathyrus sativus]
MAALSLVDAKTNAEEYKIVHFLYKHNRSIRKISTGNIYKQTLLSRLNFTKDYKIITVKKKLHIYDNHCKDIYLILEDDIKSYRSKYQFLHIGLVQISIEMNSDNYVPHMPVRLRDSKYSNVEDSILVSFATSVDNRVVKFNWFPNFSTCLSDLENSNALVVTIDPPKTIERVMNEKYPLGYEPLLKVRYRVCYKLMKTSLKPDYLFQNPVVQVNTDITNFVVPQF